MEPSLADIAVELYVGPPADFVAARNARAAETADPALAARTRALKKPSVAAWVVNVFAHERAAQLAEALHLAQELQEAQEDLDARALSQLGRDRRVLTNRLAAAATELAEARGERITASTREAVQQTITAAFFDPTAAAAVASGRLIRELEPSTAFAEIADSLVGGGAPVLPETTARPVDEVKARRDRRDAERAVRDADRAHERAVRDAAAADRALRVASLRVEELDRRERDLEAELTTVRNDAKRARAEVQHAGEEQQELAQRIGDTDAALRAAQAALGDLGRS
ncbi:transposase [Microbacterium phyllosphaerae]|uniref:transposase n=1 Tax=Microbacterium phyllosphaerae TaxID=124798 RepID=UPI000EA2136D|nr:transposase [Microbacterium phyllosphaerae]